MSAGCAISCVTLLHIGAQYNAVGSMLTKNTNTTLCGIVLWRGVLPFMALISCLVYGTLGPFVFYGGRVIFHGCDILSRILYVSLPFWCNPRFASRFPLSLTIMVHLRMLVALSLIISIMRPGVATTISGPSLRAFCISHLPAPP